MHRCTHTPSLPQNDLFSLHNATLCLAAGVRCAEDSVGKEGGLRCWCRNCITSEGALQGYGGRGPSLVLARPGNAEGAGWRDGWTEDEEEEEVAWGLHKRSLTHTHSSSILWCPSCLDPSSFWISEPALAGSYTVERGFSVPSPHHMHTQTYTLSLKFSHSNDPRCCI